MMTKKTALIVLTDTFEEIEAVTPIDILRRAEVEVTVASRTGSTTVKGRSGITVVADCLLDAALADGKTYDLVILPGGPGHVALRTDTRVLNLVREQVAAGRLTGAICAAPTVLKDAGVLKGRRITAHFSVLEELPNILEKEDVVIDGTIVTSRGAGTAVPFSLALVEKLCGYEKALKIAHAICTGIKSLP
jgi:4-methyl-5(b-hydroxyethyl)-thiazole monophosphate biosynthesis